MSSQLKQRLLTWGILITLAFVWGSSFILMKRGMFAPDGSSIFSASQVAAIRMGVAFLFLLPWVLPKLKVMFGKHWKSLLAVGIFGNCVPAFLFTAAQVELDSSYIGMLNSLVPLFTMLIAIFAFKTKVRSLNIIGILIGLGGALGLILMQGIDMSGNLLAYSGLVVAATVCYAISVNVIRNNLSGISPLLITALAFSFVGPATLIYLFTTDFTTVLATHTEAYNAMGYIVVLAIVGTALAVILFNKLIQMTSGIFAASVTYLIPIVAIFWGWLDGELISGWSIVFSLVILGGVYLVNMKAKSKE
jgi:drug/metabolite transporter (DMT)-like permease